MRFTLPIIALFDPDLDESSSQLYKDFKLAVEKTVNEAFKSCPGYLRGSCTVTKFRNGSVDADYSTQYDGETVYSSKQDIVDYINTTVINNLANASIIVGNNTYDVYSTVTEVMRKNLTTEQLNLDKSPCDVDPVAVCDLCNNCTGKAGARPACVPRCDSSDKYCVIVKNEPICSYYTNCQPHYLPVGSDCVDENIIIGVSVGVGGAIIIGLVIAVIVLACTKPKSKKSKKGGEGEHHEYEESQVHKGYDNVSLNIEEIALKDSTGDALQHQQPPQQLQHRLEDNEPAVDYDEVVQKNIPVAVQQNQHYSGFQPQLQNIDTTTNYSIMRPQFGPE
jgi:hypothetical protein